MALTAKPYLRELSIRNDEDIDTSRYPFSIPAVRIATHSPILLAYPNAKILLFDQAGISEAACEDTEHYAIARDFLNHYERRLRQLLGDDQDTE